MEAEINTNPTADANPDFKSIFIQKMPVNLVHRIIAEKLDSITLIDQE